MLRKGFTLIELMVVIAVIGILSSLVLVTYPTAQGRANDGVIMSDADQIRVAAEVFYGINGSYSGLADDTDVAALVADADSRNGADETDFVFVFPAAGFANYCASIEMNSGQYWCVDSRYHSGAQGAACAANSDCAGAAL